MVIVPLALLAVQGIHLDSGLPVSRPCCFRPAICSWVVVVQTVCHSLRQSTSILGVASSVECGKSCSRLGGGHGHWLALGWHWYHSDQCYCLGRIAGWVPVSWDSGEDPPVIISIDASR